MKTQSFDIRITKRVVFHDHTGATVKVYEVGEIVKATADNGHYWVTSMGGIFKPEAERVDD